MDDEPSQKPSKVYGKHSKKFWIIVYLVIAVVVYGLIYLVLIHKGGNSAGSSGYHY